MSTAKAVRLTAVGAVVIYSVILYTFGIKVGADGKKLVSFIPAVLATLFLVYEKWAWRWPLLDRFGPPRIEGTWKVTGTPHPKSRIDAANKKPFGAFIVIEQTLLTTHVSLVTGKSESASDVAVLKKVEGSRKWVLVYTYGNLPDPATGSSLPKHRGAARLQVTGRRPEDFTGDYYTDRFTCGQLLGRRVSTEAEEQIHTKLVAAYGSP